MKQSLIDMMKDEFRPFRDSVNNQEPLTQVQIDYNLAKIRQRINECKILVDMVM